MTEAPSVQGVRGWRRVLIVVIGAIRTGGMSLRVEEPAVSDEGER